MREAILKVLAEVSINHRITEGDVADRANLDYNEACDEMDRMSKEDVIERLVYDGEMWVRGKKGA